MSRPQVPQPEQKRPSRTEKAFRGIYSAFEWAFRLLIAIAVLLAAAFAVDSRLARTVLVVVAIYALFPVGRETRF